MPGILMFNGPYQPPFDEGVKLVADHLRREMARLGPVLMTTTAEGADPDVAILPRQPLGFLRGLRRLCKDHRPDAVLYVPDASLNRYSLARCGMLRWAAGKIPLGMVTLQPGTVDLAVRVMVRLWRPDAVFAQADTEGAFCRRRGIRYEVLPPAVDTDRFRPAADAEERAALRRKYALPTDATLCLHVGHIRANRNLDWLLDLDLPHDARLLIVGSTSRALEEDLRRALAARHAIIFDSYLPAIEEIYRAADLYLFPVEGDRSAIAMPLSVLEAMASDLPVVATPFGGLVRCFKGVAGVWFAATRGAFHDAVRQALAAPPANTRAAVQTHTWPRLAAQIWEQLKP